MTELEQEALSKQHSHGVWLVGLSDGSFAVFIHPQGQLLSIIPFSKDEMESVYCDLLDELGDAADRYLVRTSSETIRQKKKEISLSDLGL